MSNSDRPQKGRKQRGDVVSRSSETRKKMQAIMKAAQKAGEAACETRARAHQVIDTARRVLKEKKEVIQHTQAWRERQAELGGLPAAPAPRTAVDILLIEDALADVALIRQALKASALCGELKVLRQRSDIEAFIREAATAAPLFHPQLIVVDCIIPGMEAAEIVAALRRIPAYQPLPIVLFSGLAEEEGRQRSVQCGATAFIHKPSELTAYIEAVATMVRRWGGVKSGTAPAPEREGGRKEQTGSPAPSAD